MRGRYLFYAPCARGLEPLLADELRRLKARGVRPQKGGALFAGDLAAGYRVALWSRIASRVLLSIDEVDATDAESLYDGVKAIPWEEHVRAGGTIAVNASGSNESLRNTQFTAVRVKDGIADRFRDRFGRRPSVDTRAPELRVNVVVRSRSAKIAIDLSGDPLHRRGYREPGVQVMAPLKETLAAAVLEIAGWREIAAEGGAFFDPFCGSATLPVEAALVALDRAPGLLRRSWGFDRWLGHDDAAWAALLAEARGRAEASAATRVEVWGSDADAAAIDVARGCLRRAGLASRVVLRHVPLDRTVPPDAAAHGLIATNPPYGERLAERRDLPGLYREMGAVLRGRFSGWRLAVITSDEGLESGLSANAVRSVDVMNGRIPAKVRVFDPPWCRGARRPDQGSDAFRNRLEKMARHYRTWARRTGVTCYRIYDADLPDYNVALDLYTGAGQDAGRLWLHLAEYSPPPGVDAARATARLEEATRIAAEVLGVAGEDVFVKRRERQRGGGQYVRASTACVTGIVQESGLFFEVNLSDYLDTGIFLDHRETRSWLRELADGRRFLNLFGYTGTASVHAAAGHASRTTTVDLSATYLAWAERNLRRNGCAGPEHELVRGDVLAWVREARDNGNLYDLIFCDPPTFSNSKRMSDTWDVQRDHAHLITDVAGLMSEDGLLIFSCNRRGFRLDEVSLTDAGLGIREVTRRTIPKDFDRVPPPHRCWTVRRS